MFRLRQTSDDIFIKNNLRPRSLSRGMFFEIHLSSLLNTTLTLHSLCEVSKGRFLAAGTNISDVKSALVPGKGGTEMISFQTNDQTYTVTEGEFSRIIKKCFHTTNTLCFSCRPDDRPDKINENT